MRNHRPQSLPRLDMSHAVKLGAVLYLSINLVVILAAIITYSYIQINPPTGSGSVLKSSVDFMPVVIWMGNIIGMGLIYLLIRHCRQCRSGQGRRISTALDKLSHGDLGWKITLRRGDELAEVADSVTLASKSLGERVAGLQAKAKELAGVEEYLLDSIDTGGGIDPYTLKALRKMKICTSRLLADMEEFQVSSLSSRPPTNLPHTKRETVSV
ncbi:MAG: hypothetical protein GY841_18155 [FCB group bacterium]|nr:hypothetical protein [FCB group bacterium]